MKSGSPNQAQGSASILRVQDSGNNRALIAFDQAAIASAVGTETLVSAAVELTVIGNGANWGSSGRTVDLHRVTSAWTEAGATWNCAIDTYPANGSADCAATAAWTMSGTNATLWPFELAAAHSVLVTNDLAGVVSFDITADVTAFLAGGNANHGFIIKKTDEGAAGRLDFASRETGSAPQVVLVTSQIPPPPQPPPTSVVVNAAADTYLRAGAANRNQGSLPTLRLQANGDNRALVRFDDAELAAAVGTRAVVGATLEFFIAHNGDNWGPSGQTVALHRLSSAWSELGATWSCAIDADPTNQAADCSGETAWAMSSATVPPYTGEVSASALIENGQRGMLSLDVTSDVLAFLSGAHTNQGWVLRKTDEDAAGRIELASRETQARPRLVIVLAGEGEGEGEADGDGDGDGIHDDVDNCPALANPDQGNTDGDAAGDVCDPCPTSAANDPDNDGACGDADCDDHDATRYPGADEVCDDGTDQDCDGADEECPIPDPRLIAPPVDPTAEPTFLDAYGFLSDANPPVVRGIAPGTIEELRAAVIRGRVLTSTGEPLPGARITVVGHPELGFTRSRSDGEYDLLVNAGGRMSVQLDLPGFTTAQRSAEAPWNEVVVLDDAVLTPLGPAVEVDANAIELQVVRGEVAIDGDGVRQATLLLEAGTGLDLIAGDGTTTPLSTAHVRVTELTVGDNGPLAMPAELPPSSAYTYAVQITVDEAVAAGATRVELTNPATIYVEDFLGFGPGVPVPVGMYDTATARWVGVADGIVLRVLAGSGGLSDVDTDGDGVAEDAATLASLDLTDDERLTLALLYAPGAVLQRARLPHFSSADLNAAASGRGRRRIDPETNQPPEKDCRGKGSEIHMLSQLLGQRLPVGGTQYSLAYRSDRLPGYRAGSQLEMTLPDDPDVEESAVVRIAGRVLDASTDPDGVARLEWDARDVYGRRLWGPRNAEIEVRRSFPASYLRSGACWAPESLFAGWSCGAPLRDTRIPGLIVERRRGRLGMFDARAQRLGGFTLSAHHRFLPEAGEVFLGDGRRIGNAVERPRTDRVPFAGYLPCTMPGGDCRADGTPIAQAELGAVEQFLVEPSGDILFVDADNNQLRRLALGGSLSTVAGVPNPGSAPLTDALRGDGGPATAGRFRGLRGLALGDDGSIYLADLFDARVRRVTSDGLLETFAGTSVACSSALTCDDGQPAIAARVSPSKLAIWTDGSLLILHGSRVRRVAPNGVLDAFAGAPSGGVTNPNGVMATAAQFGSLRALVVLRDGTVVVTRGQPRIVWAIDNAGMVRIIAGSGGPAVDPPDQVTSLLDVAAGPTGSVVVADFNGLIEVNPDGTASGFLRMTRGSSSGGVAIGNGRMFDTDGYTLFEVIDVAGRDLLSSERIIPSEDGRELWVFDRTGRHLKTLDERTGVAIATFAYDPAGLLLGVTDRNGLTTTIERGASADATAIVGPYGERTELLIGTDGLLREVANAEGERVGFSWHDSQGLLATMTDARGGVHRFDFDAAGRLVRDEGPTGDAQTLSRERLGDGHVRVTHATPEGRSTRYERQVVESRETRTTTFSDGHVAERSADDTGEVFTVRADGTMVERIEVSDPRLGTGTLLNDYWRELLPSGLEREGSETRSFTVDIDGTLLTDTRNSLVGGSLTTRSWRRDLRERTVLTDEGRTMRVVEDTVGRPVEMQSGGLAPLVLTYDANGRVASARRSAGTEERLVELSYGTDGRVAAAADAESRSTAMTRDAVGRVMAVDQPGARHVALSYDDNGNLTSLIPPSRPEHTMTYDPRDLLSTTTAPTVGASPQDSTRAYDRDRRPTILTLPSGRTVTTTYESAGRPASTSFDGDTIAMSYDAAYGQLVSLDSATGVDVGFTWDGPLRTSQTFSGAVSGTLTTPFGDDDLVPYGEALNGTFDIYQYRDGDQLIAWVNDLVLTRDQGHGAVLGAAAGVVETTYALNAFGEVESADTGALVSISHTRDRLGRITQKLETRGAVTTTTAYGYTDAGQLAFEDVDGARTDFTFDQNGNRTQAGPATCSFDDRDQLVACGGVAYGYNDDGQLASKDDGGEVTLLDYDARGGLRRVVLPDGTEVEYVLDATGRRVGKKVDGALVRQWLWNSPLRIAAELDGAGNLISRFAYATRANVPDLVKRGGVTYRIVQDHLGSPLFVVDITSGAVVQERRFDAWGKTLVDTNPGFLPFGFAGGLEDIDTELVRFGARDYDPESGRWTAADPISFAGGDPNLYGYVLGDPVNWTDRHGLWVDGPPEVNDPIADEAAMMSFGIGAGAVVAGIELGTSAISAVLWDLLGPYLLGAISFGGSAVAIPGFCPVDPCDEMLDKVLNACMVLINDMPECEVLAFAYRDACEAARAMSAH